MPPHILLINYYYFYTESFNLLIVQLSKWLDIVELFPLQSSLSCSLPGNMAYGMARPAGPELPAALIEKWLPTASLKTTTASLHWKLPKFAILVAIGSREPFMGSWCSWPLVATSPPEPGAGVKVWQYGYETVNHMAAWHHSRQHSYKNGSCRFKTTIMSDSSKLARTIL